MSDWEKMLSTVTAASHQILYQSDLWPTRHSKHLVLRQPRCFQLLLFLVLLQSPLVIVVQSLSCVRLCDPMDCSMPGFPVLHHLPEFAQIHVH